LYAALPMTSATRRPWATAAGTVTAGVGMESAEVTRAGAAGMTGCGAPDAKAASLARAVSRLEAALSPRNWLGEFSAF